MTFLGMQIQDRIVICKINLLEKCQELSEVLVYLHGSFPLIFQNCRMICTELEIWFTFLKKICKILLNVMNNLSGLEIGLSLSSYIPGECKRSHGFKIHSQLKKLGGGGCRNVIAEEKEEYELICQF
jgi:hypothetical protein